MLENLKQEFLLFVTISWSLIYLPVLVSPISIVRVVIPIGGSTNNPWVLRPFQMIKKLLSQIGLNGLETCLARHIPHLVRIVFQDVQFLRGTFAEGEMRQFGDPMLELVLDHKGLGGG